MLTIPNFAVKLEFSATGILYPGGTLADGVTLFPMQSIPSKYALQVTGYDAAGAVIVPSAWDVLLLGSLDGVNFDETSELAQHVNGTNANGAMVWSGTTTCAFLPVRFAAVKCKTLTLGSATKIVVWAMGVS